MRMALLSAGALLLIAAPLPWLNATVPFHGDVSTNGFALPGDGAITFSMGLGLLAIAWFTSGTTSRFPPVVLAPLILGLATVALTITGYRLNEVETTRILNGGGEASDGIGLALTGIAGAAAALLGVVRVLRAGRRVDYRPRMSRPTVARVAAGLVGSVGTVVAIIAMAPGAAGAANAGGVTFIVMFGGLFGAYAGVAIVALVERLVGATQRRAGP